ncbi:MAG: hypothetical protein ACI9UN_003416 [Granulosicoccus sp.]|jgi:hypothetical protein
MQIQRMKMTNRKSSITTQAPLLTTAVLLASLVIQPALAADEGIYKKIGSDGSVVFTDKPRSNTVAVESRRTIPVKASEPILDTSIRSNEFSSDTLGGRGKGKVNIRALRIISPTNNQTLSDPQGTILIDIAMGPDKSLPRGHKAQIQMNGEIVSNGRRTRTNVPTPGRGTHLFEARIMNSKGSTLARSAPVKVYIA